MLALLQSGPPFSVTTQTNTTNAFSAGAQRADLLRDPVLPNSERTLSRWFDTSPSTFAQPAARTFGTAGRGILRGDGTVNFDISILKNFYVHERKGFQFRVEMINAFNHPNFGLPGATFGGPGFGVVSSAAAGRSLQLGLRFAF
jgi:hypothetical protein